MIILHRLTDPDHRLYLNPDLIQTIEAHPDTVIALENASKIVVAETPEQIVELIRTWRSSVITCASGHTAPVLRLHPHRD